MASATITLKDKADANVVFSLVGQTADGALYRDATRSLALPRTLEFKFNLGQPGSLGNDKITVTIKNSVADSDGKVFTLQEKVELSIPRSTAVTTAMVEDIICHLQALSVEANAESLADALVP
jgi:hypothetical protein